MLYTMCDQHRTTEIRNRLLCKSPQRIRAMLTHGNDQENNVTYCLRNLLEAVGVASDKANSAVIYLN
ncbi:hypothetical protein DMENIID0001_170680 [Sergentomyia squamirostris]